MTRRRMLLLIIGSLITVSTAVGVGVNFATANGSSQASSIKGIDTSSPIIRDGEETKVIDKEEDKSPSTPPAKVEINDKRTVSQTQNKDKQEPVKQTTPPTNSPVVIRKEGGTSNTNNKGTQLIIGDASKLNLPQKENKEESKDSKPKPAVVIIKDSPTPPPAKEVKKSEEQSGSSKQNPTGAPVGFVGKPQPQQKTSPQQKEEEKEIANKSSGQPTQGEHLQQNSEVEVEAPKTQENNPDSSSNKQNQQAEQGTLESSEPNQDSQTEVINLTQNSEQHQNKDQLDQNENQLTEPEKKVNLLVKKFESNNKIDENELDKLAKEHTIKSSEYDLFFKSIPSELIKNPQKLANLSTFWMFNWAENLKKELNMDEDVLSRAPGLREQGREKFNKALGLDPFGRYIGKIVSSGGSITVEGVPNRPSDSNRP